MRRPSALKEFLWVVAAFGAVAIVVRLLGGLGASTDLSDSMPWGLWKIFNMVAGVALATGGFVLAATVYIFNLPKYKPALRPAVLIAFLGYGISCFALFLDIGLPHRIWKPIFFWNHHSFLFEVAWCVMLYFSITILEVAPMVLEKYGFPRLVGLFHKATIPIVIVGITLSSLHHTSLGSLFLVMPARLHELWFTPWIPGLFILSAMGAGIQMVILVMLAYSHFYRRERNMPMLTGLAKASAVILGTYFVVKIADLAARGQVPTLFSGQWETGFFFAELLLGVLIPVIIAAIPSARATPLGLAAASASAVAGLVLNRLNVGITGLVRTADAAYFPTLTEMGLSFGVIAMTALAFIYIAENFRIFEETPARDPAVTPDDARESDQLGRAWDFGLMTARGRVSLLVALSVALAAGLFSADALEGIEMERAPVRPPMGVDEARAVLRIDGDRDNEAVAFKHDAHKEQLGGTDSCGQCHHLDLPEDRSPSCCKCHADMRLKSSIFDHSHHVARLGDKWSCRECHDPRRPKNLENSEACHECHREDMRMEAPNEGRYNFMADSYMNAMHGLCLPCHRQEDEKAGPASRGTAECAFCHQRSPGQTEPSFSVD